jgi:hypothetical protein
VRTRPRGLPGPSAFPRLEGGRQDAGQAIARMAPLNRERRWESGVGLDGGSGGLESMIGSGASMVPRVCPVHRFEEGQRMARSQSSKGPKGSSGNSPQKPETVKLKLTLDRETARLLRLEAFGRDCSLGQVVVDLVRSSPRRFVLTDRGSKGTLGSDGSGAGQGSGLSEAHGGVRGLGLVSEAG